MQLAPPTRGRLFSWRAILRRAGEAAREMGGWIQAGKLKTREDVVEGLDAFPKAFDMLFTGANIRETILFPLLKPED